MVTADFADGWLQGLSEPDDQLRTEWVDFDFARHVFYADCDDSLCGRSHRASSAAVGIPVDGAVLADRTSSGELYLSGVQ